MEFLLISSPELTSAPPSMGALLADVPLRNPHQPRLKFYGFDGLFLASNEMTADEVSAIGFDGSAIDDNRAYNSFLNSPPSHSKMASFLDGSMDSENKSSLRGIFCTVRVNPHTRAFNIATDPISAYPILICGFGETLIVSNNINLIETAVYAFGLSLTRTSKSLVMAMGFGMPLGNRTGFREVSLLPPGKMITGLGPNWRILDQAPSALPSCEAKQDYLEQLTARAKHNLSVCRKLLGTETVTHRTSNPDLASLLPAATGIDMPADHSEALWRIRNTSGVAPLSAEELGRPFGVPTLSAAYDTSLTLLGQKPRSRSLFWRAPFTNLLAFSNNDPVYFAALAASLKRQGRFTAGTALEMARQNLPQQSLLKRPFLRMGMEALIDQIQQTIDIIATNRPTGIAAAHIRSETIALTTENHSAPVFAPFVDPMFAAGNINRRTLGIDGETVLVAIHKSQSAKTIRESDQKPSTRLGTELWTQTVSLGNEIATVADCWAFLDRKKTLQFLANSKNRSKQPGVIVQLFQIFQWIAR